MSGRTIGKTIRATLSLQSVLEQLNFKEKPSLAFYIAKSLWLLLPEVEKVYPNTKEVRYKISNQEDLFLGKINGIEIRRLRTLKECYDHSPNT